MQADLVPTGQHAAKKGNSPVGQFFVNFSILASKNKEQAAILLGMLFTLIIWIFSALSLMMAVIFYIAFLWHHIRDGSLSRYCRRKIDKRLHKIVMIRVNRALEKDNKGRGRQAAKGMRVGTPQGDFKRQPTVPVLDTEGHQEIKPISRQTTQINTTSPDPHPPLYDSSTDALRREPTVPDVSTNSVRSQPPSRSTTHSSAQSSISYSDNAPLISSAAPLGYGPSVSNHAPARINSERAAPSYMPPNHGVTGASQSMQRPFGPSTLRSGPPPRQGTDLNRGVVASGFPHSQPPQGRKPMPLNGPFNPMGPPRGQRGISRRPLQEFEMQSQPAGGGVDRQPPNYSNYVAFNPNNLNRGSAPLAGPLPARNFTQPQRPPPTNYFGSNHGPPQRSGTAPIRHVTSHNDDLYEAYGGSWQEPQATILPPRPATAGPGRGTAPQRPPNPRF